MAEEKYELTIRRGGIGAGRASCAPPEASALGAKTAEERFTHQGSLRAERRCFYRGAQARAARADHHHIVFVSFDFSSAIRKTSDR